MRVHAVFAIVSLAILAAMPVSFAVTAPCEDGTAYGQCSTKSPGYYCTASGPDRNTLQLFIRDGQNKPTKCHCSNFAGYAEVGGACVKSTCTVNGQTVQAGACKDYMKCANGTMAEDANACGCPAGKKAQDGVCVDRKDGCRWPGSVKCLSYQECKFDANTPTDDGTCQAKAGCQYSQYNGQACNVEIEACNQNTGTCDKIAGACLSNSECSGGKTCNAITKRCEEASSSGAGASAPLLGAGASTPPADAATPGAKPSFCCLPAALGAGMVGLAIASRRRK